MERVKLKKLLKSLDAIEVRGSKESEITGLSDNSKRVIPGDLFIAKKGLTHDGTHFIPEAIANGATAVLTDLYDPFYPHITQILHKDVAQIEPLLAREYYGPVDTHLFLIGVTGTNGKTTTTRMIHHLLTHFGEKPGLIGSIEWITGQGHAIPATATTPDLLTNYKLLAEMVSRGSRSCVMEVSSHALVQGRVASLQFETALFTQLAHDHLDYHHTMQEYARAKAKLFTGLMEGKTAVVNQDCPYTPLMLAECRANVLTYGLHSTADLFAADVHFDAAGLRCTIHFQGQALFFSSSLIGRHNVYNFLSAIGATLIRGYPLREILQAFAPFCAIPGRLERVENRKGLNVFVDYAHKPEALCSVLEALKELHPKRLISVFGCGGNRDTAKRPKMGSIAEALSDLVILTNDNPRNEDPEAILLAILSGIKLPERVLVLPDRREAIQRALDLATPGDIVLIAGKGHETYQIFSHQTIDFDDRQIVREC